MGEPYDIHTLVVLEHRGHTLEIIVTEYMSPYLNMIEVIPGHGTPFTYICLVSKWLVDVIAEAGKGEELKVVLEILAQRLIDGHLEIN